MIENNIAQIFKHEIIWNAPLIVIASFFINPE